MKWKEINPPTTLLHCRSFVNSEKKLSVFVGQENNKWHLSIAHQGSRYPTWDEIKFARYTWIPNDVTMAMILPPKEEYINVHSNCFHIHEIDGELLLEK